MLCNQALYRNTNILISVCTFLLSIQGGSLRISGKADTSGQNFSSSQLCECPSVWNMTTHIFKKCEVDCRSFILSHMTEAFIVILCIIDNLEYPIT